MIEEDLVNFDITPPEWNSEDTLIKVIGVGGGGCNAVNYMYKQKIQGCSFFVCNTDKQALDGCDVPSKIQLGEGLGAGTNPAKARNAALESQDEIAAKVLTPATQMLFITAGMGGGTGTGASPVIAKMSKDKGILTVAVVTLPFKNEGPDFLSKAVDGIHEIEKYVDSLLIINNEKLREVFGNELLQHAFPKTDEVLATAVKGIIEIINKPGYQNVDFEDVKTMMRGSGMALMGYGAGKGENRLAEAVKQAMESPLLNDFDLSTSRNLLINVTCANNDNGLQLEEYNRITDLVNEYTGNVSRFKRGVIWDDNKDADDTVHITVIATGFKMNLVDVAGADMGKLILIDKNFRYEDINEKQVPNNGEIVLTDDININVVGRGSREGRRTFHYEEGYKPVLILEEGSSRSELESTPAIYRIARSKE